MQLAHALDHGLPALGIGGHAERRVFLGEARERAKAGGVAEVATHVGKGDPAGAIIAQARRRKSDLIVLGTRGLSTTEGMLLGSVSRKVANLCTTNCLIVR